MLFTFSTAWLSFSRLSLLVSIFDAYANNTALSHHNCLRSFLVQNLIFPMPHGYLIQREMQLQNNSLHVALYPMYLSKCKRVISNGECWTITLPISHSSQKVYTFICSVSYKDSRFNTTYRLLFNDARLILTISTRVLVSLHLNSVCIFGLFYFRLF